MIRSISVPNLYCYEYRIAESPWKHFRGVSGGYFFVAKGSLIPEMEMEIQMEIQIQMGCAIVLIHPGMCFRNKLSFLQVCIKNGFTGAFDLFKFHKFAGLLL